MWAPPRPMPSQPQNPSDMYSLQPKRAETPQGPMAMTFLSTLWTTLRFLLTHPLTSGHRLDAILKFLRWQCAARLMKCSVVIPWVDNSRFLARLGETGLTGNLYAGFMEYEDMLFLLHALREEDVFVDVGANVGAYTILASRVVGSRTIAFEPVPRTVERLADQILVNRVESRVEIRPQGVGGAIGQLHFTNNHDTVNHVSREGTHAHTTQVEVTTLDAALEGDGSFIVKIDVEGFEYEVLQGAAATLSSSRVLALIIELNGSSVAYGHSIEDIHQAIVGFGFIPVAYDPRHRSIRTLPSFNASASNTIYIKQQALIESRCREAPRRIVHTAFGQEI